MKTEIKYNWNILTHRDAILQLKNGKMPAPHFCTLQTINACNQHCKGCSFGGYTEAKLNGYYMSKEDHFTVINKLVSMGVRAFEFAGGGEPTLFPWLVDLMYYLYERNCSVGLITNGVRLTDEIIAALIYRGTYCRISLEASTKEQYMSYKRVPEKHWDIVLKNVKKLISENRNAQSPCDVSIKFDVGKSLRGLNHYMNALELGWDLKVDSVQFKFFRHEPEELEVQEKLDEYVKLKQLLEIVPYSINIINGLVPYTYPVPQCWLNPIHTVVDYLGDVYICCYYYYRMKEMKLGNMLNESFEKFWYSQEHWNKIRNINKEECTKVDCKFFAHHQKVKEAFINGRQDFL